SQVSRQEFFRAQASRALGVEPRSFSEADQDFIGAKPGAFEIDRDGRHNNLFFHSGISKVEVCKVALTVHLRLGCASSDLQMKGAIPFSFDSLGWPLSKNGGEL